MTEQLKMTAKAAYMAPAVKCAEFRIEVGYADSRPTPAPTSNGFDVLMLKN